ncbi:MAG: hypothetical protein DI563_04850 [Variovorax paradoxus]|uniref:Uncharacterized protein n=1 Tax=Variovorax paradoxus TaxID=34073 RepID=A0A2W5S308_VARPD|nr:MAG: hypothetical protein DI563_04850 [Variovorax paradoxus]
MICAEVNATTGAITPTPAQPADLATCPVVLVTGSELSAVTGIAFPAPADFAAAWGVGFFLVVASYVIGWGPGAVLRFISHWRN